MTRADRLVEAMARMLFRQQLEAWNVSFSMGFSITCAPPTCARSLQECQEGCSTTRSRRSLLAARTSRTLLARMMQPSDAYPGRSMLSPWQ